jgi:hypothetical protein
LLLYGRAIVDINDLPLPILVPYDAHYDHSPCPRGGPLAYRHKCDQRTLHALGDWRAALSALAWPGSHDTRRGIDLAGRIVVEDGLP